MKTKIKIKAPRLEPAGQSPVTWHPAFRAYTQGRMPFPHEIDFWSMLDAEPWLYEFQQELQEELNDMATELSEAIQELNLLRMPVDCHADEKALALLLSIGNGRFVQDLFEAMQTAMFDMAVRLDGGDYCCDFDDRTERDFYVAAHNAFPALLDAATPKPAPLPGEVGEAIKYLKNHLAFEADRTLSEDTFLAAVQTRMMRFAKHFRTILAALSDLQAQLAEAQDMRMKHAAHAMRKTHKATAYQDRMEWWRWKASQYKELLTACFSGQSEIRAQLAAKGRECEELREDAVCLSYRYADFICELWPRMDKYEADHADYMHLKARCEALEAETASQQKALESDGGHIASLNLEIDGLERALSITDERCKSAEAERDGYKARCEDMKRALYDISRAQVGADKLSCITEIEWCVGVAQAALRATEVHNA